MANDLLADVIDVAFKSKDQNDVIGVLEMLRHMMEKDKHLIVPVEWIEENKKALSIKIEDGVQKAVFENGANLAIRHIDGKNKEDWLVAFTNFIELQKGVPTFSVPVLVKDLFQAVKDSEAKGIVINPFGSPFLLGETMIDMIIEASKSIAQQKAEKTEN